MPLIAAAWLILALGTAGVQQGSRFGLLQGCVHAYVGTARWTDAAGRPGFNLLLEYRRGLYQICFTDSAAAAASLTAMLAQPAGAVASFCPIVDSTLVVGHRYGAGAGGESGGDPSAWLVESSAPLSDRVPWRARASVPSWWRLARRTLPDHEVMDFVPGIGIIGYLYRHHGTVAETEVALAAVDYGGS